MSKIGKQPISLIQGVTAVVEGSKVTVTGPKGSLVTHFKKDLVEVVVENSEVIVKPKRESKVARSAWGTIRALIANNVKGVSEGYKKQLELVGTGYRSEVQGNNLILTVGYSHTVPIEAPVGITFKVEKGVINIDGIDKHLVGQVAANIRSARPPEPYKGKGIKYMGEVIRRKAGKAAKAAA